MSIPAEGGCLCGAVRYRVTASMIIGTLCHCSSCRKASGAPTVAWACFEEKDFAFVQGEPIRYESSPGVERTFCGRCGTPLTFRRVAERDWLDVTTASLDDPEAFAPTKEIWTEHRIAWECTNPALEQFSRSSVYV